YVFQNIFVSKILFRVLYLIERKDGMNKDDKNSGENEEFSLPFSLRLELFSSFLELIAIALDIWAIVEGIEEENIAEEKEKAEKDKLNEELEQMQLKIDLLTDELNELKRDRNSYY